MTQKTEDPYQGVNLKKTDLNTIKRLIEFSLDYEVYKPTEASLDREEDPKMYSTMQKFLSKENLADDDLVQVENTPTKFNFKSLKNDE